MRVRANKTPRTLGGKLYVFDSGHEADVCTDLWMQQKAGIISSLQFQPKFVFIVNGVTVGSFKPDAVYHDKEAKLHVIEAKGFKLGKPHKRTGKRRSNPRVDKGFSMRKKLMLALFGIEVEIR